MTSDRVVSVIIPVFNSELYVDEAIQSVLAQTFAPIEIVVVNDGSTDGSEKRIDAYGSQILAIHRQTSGGRPAIPRNVGLRSSSGKYICFLDSDDVMLPDHVSVQVNFLESYSDVGCVFGDYRNFSRDAAEPLTHFQTCPKLSVMLETTDRLVLPSEVATKLLLHENLGLPSSMAIRREVLKFVPEFPSDLSIGEDFHFVYRVSRHFSVGIVNEMITLRRLHGGNITRNQIRTLHDYITSWGILRASETGPEQIEMLDGMLHQCEVEPCTRVR